MTDLRSGPAVTVLPPREHFAPNEAGAIALLVQRVAAADEIVVGTAPQGTPFPDVRFEAVGSSGLWSARWPRHAFWPPFGLRAGPQRYAAAVAEKLATLAPSQVEIHNRPEVARCLRRWFPDVPMRLVLHNDPCGMRSIRQPGERTELARSLAVACVSEWVRDRYLEDSDLSPEELTVLPNCLDLSTLPHPVRPDARDPVILFVGRMVADKGADCFVGACAKALPQLAGWKACMIGADRFGAASPETPFLTALRPRAAETGVTLAGYRPHEAVLEAMSRAAITVVPSRWQEPFGLTALEAMACGSTLIASPRGSLRQLVGQAALLVDPENIGALAAAMVRAAQDEMLREALFLAGQERAISFDVVAARQRRALAPAF